MNELKINGIYRGTVLSNYDPEVKGRIKVYVPGVYPEVFSNDASSLPWAEPCMDLFGGGHTPADDIVAGTLNKETGSTSAPHIGAEVFVMFEQGDQNYPIYVGATQSGIGWISEHKNQHVIQTDNVRIRIDEEPTLQRSATATEKETSTCKFDSYNSKCTSDSVQNHTKEAIPTTLDIEVLGNVNVIINGNINMFTKGTFYHEHIGDKHITTTGNIYEKHEGYLHHERIGGTTTKHDGNIRTDILGTSNLKQVGDINEHLDGSRTTDITSDEIHRVGDRHETSANYRKSTARISDIKSVIGASIEEVEGYKTTSVAGTISEITTPNPATGLAWKSETIGANKTTIVAGNQVETITGTSTEMTALKSEVHAGGHTVNSASITLSASSITLNASQTTITGKATTNGLHSFPSSTAGDRIGIH